MFCTTEKLNSLLEKLETEKVIPCPMLLLNPDEYNDFECLVSYCYDNAKDVYETSRKLKNGNWVYLSYCVHADKSIYCLAEDSDFEWLAIEKADIIPTDARKAKRGY